MKKILSILMVCLALIGCGDDVTNVNGYTDEQVAQIIAASRDTVYQVTEGDSVITYIYVTDTLYNEIIDTVYKMSIDTVVSRVTDTIVTTLVDTIYNRVVDTVVTTLVDTIYSRVVDTVFTTLNSIGVDTERPRDTTITVSEDIDGAVISKVYNGKVFNGVFYDTTMYVYYNGARYVGEELSSNVGIAVMVNRCGEITKPNSGDFHIVATSTRTGYDNYTDKSRYPYFKIFSGWRTFNEADAYALRNALDQVIPEGKNIFTSRVGKWSTDSFSPTMTATVASTYTYSKTVSYYNSKDTLYYICAYDLNQSLN